MSSKKIKDLVVSVSTYVDNQGQTKHRYLNVGSMMQNEHGVYLILDKTFNPAGIIDNKEGCFISCFDVKDRSKQPQYQQNSQQPTQQAPKTQSQVVDNMAAGFDDINDSVPFIQHERFLL